ncbi:hypothetical protein ACCO45_005338 [Purpureocillium lilacinum]|uniref:Uncharacterized protein n=1 Tax=Purpureocillium lilacinum TaxID=33203 RepID=A0ACC4DXS4_PURLI
MPPPWAAWDDMGSSAANQASDTRLHAVPPGIAWVGRSYVSTGYSAEPALHRFAADTTHNTRCTQEHVRSHALCRGGPVCAHHAQSPVGEAKRAWSGSPVVKWLAAVWLPPVLLPVATDTGQRFIESTSHQSRKDAWLTAAAPSAYWQHLILPPTPPSICLQSAAWRNIEDSRHRIMTRLAAAALL